MSAVPAVRIATDLAHGGRWTSLQAGRREWLWHRDEPRRPGVAPGDAFADAGGVEECLPTVRGLPDHGAVWSRLWRPGGTACWETASEGRAYEGTAGVDPAHEEAAHGDAAYVEHQDFRLSRRIRTGPGGAATVDYRLTAAPGYRFVWAAHALLEVSERGRLGIREGAPARLYPDGGAGHLPFRWPRAGPVRLDALGPDDGTALGAVVDTATAYVRDGGDTLRFTVEADPGQPVSVAVWRNLRGFPEAAPYRSIGVEPMLGRVFDLAAAAAGDAAVVPATGEVRWRLTVTAPDD